MSSGFPHRYQLVPFCRETVKNRRCRNYLRDTTFRGRVRILTRCVLQSCPRFLAPDSLQDTHVARALQHVAGVLQKVVENNDTQLREMGTMLRHFATAPLQPFRGSEHDREGGRRAFKPNGKRTISLELKVRYLPMYTGAWFDTREEARSRALPHDAWTGG